MARPTLPLILQTAVAVPEHQLEQDAVKRSLCDVMALPPEQMKGVMALFDHALVERRHSVLPLDRLRQRRGLGETTAIYADHAIRLGKEVAARVLAESRVPAEAIDLVITVSCTGIMIPSLDAHLANALGFRADVKRLPITELGCVGGAAALCRAHDFLLGHPRGHVLIVAVELPTLSFQHDDVSVAQLVSTALFGDGAAAVVLGGREDPEIGPTILGTRSHLFPESTEALGFDLRDDGFHVLLAKDLPQRLHGSLCGVVDRLLEETRLTRADLTRFVLHPGGRKILNAIEAALGIDRPQAQPSWDVLREHGNTSSAAVIFVLDRWMRGPRLPARVHGLLAAFGPGLSAELCVLRWN